jgi:DNA polymerase-3 subunit epsilon
MRVLYFDTETTGLPSNKYPPNSEQQPHITQLGMLLEIDGVDVIQLDALIKPDNWRIHPCSGTGISKKSTELTGITQEMCEEGGIPIADALEMFMIATEQADAIVCHNVAFDTKIIGFEYTRLRPESGPREILLGLPRLCTMKAATPICELPQKGRKTTFKWPKLEEAMKFFYDEELVGAHSAIVDIRATRRLFHTLIEEGAFDQEFHDLKAAGKLPKEFADNVERLDG